MKNAVINIGAIILLLILILGCEPKEILPVDKSSTVNFSLPSAILEEHNSEGIQVWLHLSQAAYEPGEIIIKQINRGDYNPFITIPAISPDGILKLPVAKGSTQIMFRITPVDDQIIKGHQNILFMIDGVKGKLHKGSLDHFELQIKDDELEFKLKSYETEGNAGYYKQEFTYNSIGNLTRVLWKNGRNPSKIGQYQYIYNSLGQLSQIYSEPENRSQILFYEGGKLAKNEKPAFTEDLDFETYAFNSQGNLSAITYKIKRANGNEEILGYREFSYYPNGNVENIDYYEYSSPVEVNLLQRVSYSEYIISVNPLPFYEAIPGLLYQPKLPRKITYEEHGKTIVYHIDHVFLSNGQVSQRIVRGPAGNEITKYEYY